MFNKHNHHVVLLHVPCDLGAKCRDDDGGMTWGTDLISIFFGYDFLRIWLRSDSICRRKSLLLSFLAYDYRWEQVPSTWLPVEGRGDPVREEKLGLGTGWFDGWCSVLLFGMYLWRQCSSSSPCMHTRYMHARTMKSFFFFALSLPSLSR